MCRFGGTIAVAAVFLTIAYGQPAPRFAYGEALQKSIFFYDAQRSGHLGAENRVLWRGDSALTDGADHSVDLTGGFYDAGDHVKFGFPMAASMTMLAWGAIEYPQAYQDSKQWAPLLSNLRWGTDYLLKVSDTPGQLWGQVGAGDADHAFWGPAEAMTMARPSFRITADCPGTELAAETAAALAASSMVFKRNGDSDYAGVLLERSKALFAFADANRGKYSDCITDAANFYRSWSGYNDELAWGAAWLYRATTEEPYLVRARTAYGALGQEAGTQYHPFKWTHGWDDKSYGTYVLMSELTGDRAYREDAERWLDYWTSGFEGAHVQYTPGGLAWLDQWGSLRYSANTAFLAFIYSDWLRTNHLDDARAHTYTAFAERQINYMLGDNPRQRSYLVGFGSNPPVNVHHRGAHGSYTNNISQPEQSVHILYGALVGGPDTSDNYADSRTDFTKNEVALDYNASFVGAVARMFQQYGGDPASDFPVKETPTRTEFFVEAAVNASGRDFVEIAAYANNRSAWPARITEALTLRYFFTLDSPNPSDISLSTGYNQCGPISGPFPWFETTYFVQVTCNGVAPSGQSDFQKQVQFRIKNSVAWETSNDWSADGLGAVAEPASRIALYENDLLIWGYEPPRGETTALTFLTPSELPRAQAGQPYRIRLNAFGGVPPYSNWQVVDGNLPEGFSIDPNTGVLSGVALREGDLAFAVSVSDRAGTLATAGMKLHVDPAPALAIRSKSLPLGNVSAPYRTVLSAQGGIGPYAWSIVDGTLPDGLILNDAVISGTPQQQMTSTLTLEVADAAGTRVTAILEIQIEAALPVAPTQLRLQYRANFTAQVSNTLGPQLQVINDADTPLALAELTIRYYFTMENADALNYWCDWAAIDCKNIRSTFIAMGDRVCLELGFADSASAIPAHSSSGEIQSRISKGNWSNFDQADDYSYDPSKNVFADWDHVTVYRNGTLVWGVEP